jgi:undecaprenyl-diphosphatase
MPLYQVIVLALVQGITEFLPVSSSGHLALIPWFFGWTDPGLTFDIALHAGTLVAVLLFFFRDWVQIAGQGFGLSWGNDAQLKQNRSLLWYLAAASVPAAIFGLLFDRYAEEEWRSPLLIGTMMVAIGVVMWVAERVGKGSKAMGAVTFQDSLTIGVSQALAIVPGTSRSGITIATGLFRDLDRPAAARFSFLLATPIIAGAAASKLLHMVKHGGLPADMRMPFALGILISAVSGCLVIAFFLKYLQRHTLRIFILYRIVFGILVIALALFRRPAG